MIITKECKHCNRELPNTKEYFHSNKSYKDNLQPYCKECANKRAKEYINNLTTEQKLLKGKRKRKNKKDQKYAGHKDFRVVVYNTEGKRTFVIGTTKYQSQKYFGGAKIAHKGEFDLHILGRVRNLKQSWYICKFTNSPLFLTTYPASCKNRMTPTVNNKGYTGYGEYKQSTHKREYALWQTLLNSSNSNIPAYLYNLQHFINYVKALPKYNMWLNQGSNLGGDTLIFDTDQLLFNTKYSIILRNKKPVEIITIDNKKNIICDCCGASKPWNDTYFPRVKSHILTLKTTCRDCTRNKTLKKYEESKYSPEEYQQRLREKQQKAEVKETARQQRLIRDLLHYKAPKKRRVRPVDKVCPECGDVFPFDLEHFTKASDRFWGLDYLCKDCRRHKNRLKRENLTEEQKQRHREIEAKQRKKPINKIHHNLSKAISKQLNKLDESKNGVPSAEYIGCSFTELKEHLNKGEYTVKDYMKNTADDILFNIDHIIPKAYFTDELQEAIDNKDEKAREAVMKRCWNYRNLRVLDARTNLEKSDTLDLELIEEYGITDLL